MVSKITSPQTPLEQISTINEIIEELDEASKAETNAASYSDVIIPDTTNMKVLKTFEYDFPSRNWYSFASIPNDTTDFKRYKMSTLFRITVTGQNINAMYEVLISFRGIINSAISQPFVLIKTFSESFTNTSSGINAFRVITPKALNNQYDTFFEFYPYDATPRHVKIEVLKDNSNINWSNSLTLTNYSSTYSTATQVSNVGVYQNPTNVPALPLSVSAANTAGYTTLFLSKIIATCDFKAGEALPAGYIFVSGDKVYGITNTVEPIDTEWGISLTTGAIASGAGVSYTNFRQKLGINSTSVTLPSHDAFDTLGDSIYLRCNLVNGKIYSDSYIATSISPGYTWYCLGKVARITNGYMAIDTSGSFFFTLDANGKLTHINGKEINSGSVITVDQTYDPTSANAQSGVAIAGAGFLTGVAWGNITGTLSNQTDLYNELYYKAGDTFTGGTGQVDGCIVTNGCLTSSKKSIYFTLVMPKRVNNISTITINSMKAGIRGADGGYIVPLNTDLSTVGTVSAFKACDNMISFWLSLTTASTQTNNIPVSVMIYSMSLSFS